MLFHAKTRVSLKYPVINCSLINCSLYLRGFAFFMRAFVDLTFFLNYKFYPRFEQCYMVIISCISHVGYSCSKHLKYFIENNNFFVQTKLLSYQYIFVSPTRRRRNIKIPLCLSVPIWKSLT